MTEHAQFDTFLHHKSMLRNLIKVKEGSESQKVEFHTT